MKIGIDVRPLEDDNSTRGIGFYVKNLLPKIIEISNNDEITLFSINGDVGDLVKRDRVKIVKTPGRKSGRLNKALNNWAALNLDEYNLDVFLEPDFNYPIISKNTPLVIVAHDLIPLHFKREEFMSWRGGKQTGVNLLRYKKYVKSLKGYHRASRIIAISKFTADDFSKNLKVNIPIDVVYNGVNHTRVNNSSHQQFVLYVGGNEDRKNINFLIEAFGEISNKLPGLKLKLVGNNFNDNSNPHTKAQKELVNSLGLSKKVDFIGFVSDREKNELYCRAALFAFPSLYEGFGLPILEAMQAGCPVVAFKNSSLPEVAGDAAILVNSNQEFINGIERVLGDESIRKSMIRAGFEQAKKFSWEKTAQETLDVLKLASGERL